MLTDNGFLHAKVKYSSSEKYQRDGNSPTGPRSPVGQFKEAESLSVEEKLGENLEEIISL